MGFCLNCQKKIINRPKNDFCSQKCRFRYVENTGSDSESESEPIELNNFIKEHGICGICREILIDPVTLNCGHNFCNDCHVAWGKKSHRCGLCQHPTNKPVRQNLFLQELLTKFGGPTYPKLYQKHHAEKEREIIINEYQQSERYQNLVEIITSYLEANPIIDHIQVIGFATGYHQLEIRYVLSQLYSKKKFIIHNSTIIQSDKLKDYIIQMAPKIPSDELIYLVAKYRITDINSTIYKLYYNLSPLRQTFTDFKQTDDYKINFYNFILTINNNDKSSTDNKSEDEIEAEAEDEFEAEVDAAVFQAEVDAFGAAVFLAEDEANEDEVDDEEEDDDEANEDEANEDEDEDEANEDEDEDEDEDEANEDEDEANENEIESENEEVSEDEDEYEHEEDYEEEEEEYSDEEEEDEYEEYEE